MKSVLLFLAILPTAVVSVCPSGYSLVADGQCRGGYCGSMSLTGSAGYSTARTDCSNQHQGLLVIIHNAEQQSYWKSAGMATTRGIVLGLVCDSSTKRVKWADGSKLDYKPPSYAPQLTSDCDSAWIFAVDNNGYWDYWKSSGSYDVYCITQLHQPVPAADGCDTFEDDSEDGACYQIGKTAEDFQEAQMICRSFGADLASIHTEKENSFIRRLAVSKGATGGLYLGATLTGKGNDFGWIDGSAWDYENFSPGFPISALGSCLGMDTQGTSGDWVNVDCSSKLAVACSRQKTYTLPSCSSGTWKEGQIIYTPGFPYDASTPCDFIIAVDAGKKVQLQLFLLEANSCCDHLVLGDNYIGGILIANLTGSISNKNYTTTNSNFMRVSWQPNGGVNVQGAMFAFRGV